jgi:hypothetical protein
MKILRIKGQKVLLDDVDYEMLKDYSWCIAVNGYAVARVGGKVLYMHRVILKTPRGLFTDHINGDKLDNRRFNLRVCTPAQNAKNQARKVNNTSGYKGVSWDKAKKKWAAYIKVDYKRRFLGYFDDVRVAARTYDQAATVQHKDFARVN